MKRIGQELALLAAVAVLCLGTASHAGQGFVTKVRGTSITIDKGAEEGLEVGMTVTVVRPPEEAVIHPLTGENLGNPEIEIGRGEITRVSARAASIRLAQPLLLPVRPSDIARFVTLEEQMVMEQEMATETAEQALQDRQKIRGEASRLARNIKSIQATIKGLERSIAGLNRFDKDVVQPQFTRIKRDILTIKEELSQLRDTVELMGSLPVDEIGGEMGAAMTEEEADMLRAMIQEELDRLNAQMPALTVPEVGTEEEPLDVDDEPVIDDLMEEEETPFYEHPIFLGILAAVGLGGVAFWFIFMRAESEGDDEEDDEEEEDDDEIDEDEEDEDDDEDIEIEEEEDDIVVQES